MDQPHSESLSVHDAAAQLAEMDLPGFEDESDEQGDDRDDGQPEGGQEDDQREAENDGDEAAEQQVDADESDDAEERGASIESLADLAEALGQSVDDIENAITATIKINGEERTVSLKELKAGYQMEQDYRHKTHQLAEEKRRFDTDRQAQVSEIQKQHQVIGALFHQLRDTFVGQVDSAQLERLKSENPTEYARIRFEIEDRMKAFDQIVQQGVQAWDSMQQQESSSRQGKLATYAQGEREKLLAAIPSWNEAEAKKVFSYLEGQGFPPDQLSNVYDHREIVLAHKAMLWDQRNEQAKTVTKKVKQLPKLVKPGAPKKAINVESAKLQAAKKRLSQTGKVRDAAALIEQML